MDAVALQHIKKSYTSYSSEIVLTGQTRQSRTRQVLRDLSVCFPIGQLTVIVGRSGCGKSTLLKLLAGKEQPDAGQIEMPQGWHSALLSPDPYVITWTNVQRNVAMACGVGKTPEERYEKAADFVRLVGLQDFADLTPAELSTGMKQRLGIAMALLGSPKLLILDEPTNGLDPAGIQEMRSLIASMPQTTGATVLISSHLLGEIEQMVDQVGILNHGKVLLERSLSDLQDNTVKLQVAYQGVTEPPLPAELNILHRSHVGRVYTYIVRGSSQEILRRMQITEPVLLESIPLTLEEIFIYELGGVDYAAKDILL